ncbi:MAG: hypothetical protein Q8R28_22330 [Dehalococcoidia bacterium]|nr:hypothetical protein [Dehalococcoidia bacterium]
MTELWLGQWCWEEENIAAWGIGARKARECDWVVRFYLVTHETPHTVIVSRGHSFQLRRYKRTLTLVEEDQHVKALRAFACLLGDPYGTNQVFRLSDLKE